MRDHPITRDHPIFSHSSASSVPPRFKLLPFPITAITRSFSIPPRSKGLPSNGVKVFYSPVQISVISVNQR
jgi:hypothetical protein